MRFQTGCLNYMGCGIRHVGNFPGYEADICAQMQGLLQENIRRFSITKSEKSALMHLFFFDMMKAWKTEK